MSRRSVTRSRNEKFCLSISSKWPMFSVSGLVWLPFYFTSSFSFNFLVFFCSFNNKSLFILPRRYFILILQYFFLFMSLLALLENLSF